MALLILAVTWGLFGFGPLNRAMTGRQQGALWAEYPRFQHVKSPLSLSLHLGPGAVRNGQARVWLSRSYLEAMTTLHVLPPPQGVEARSDHYRMLDWAASRPALWTFSRDDAGAGDSSEQLEKKVLKLLGLALIALVGGMASVSRFVPDDLSLTNQTLREL